MDGRRHLKSKPATRWMDGYHVRSRHPWKSLPYMDGSIYNWNATLPLIVICNNMSKRKSSGGRTSNLLSLDLDEEQIAALEHIGEIDPPVLKCLVPVLDSICRAYSDVIPPHRRVLPVSDIILSDEKTVLMFEQTRQAIDFKHTTAAAKALDVDYREDDISYVFNLKAEHSQEPGQLSEHFGKCA